MRLSIVLFLPTMVLSTLMLGSPKDLEASPGNKPTDIRIGAILPLTGAASYYGEQARRGLDLAIEKIRKDRPGEEYKFSYVLEDSLTSPQTAVSAFRKLKRAGGVSIIISEVSGVILALAPICEREKVLLFNVGAQNPDIANAGDFTFSNINLANIESKQVAEFAFHRLGKKKAAVLFASASYGQGARDSFVSGFEALGGKIIAEVNYPVEGTDYKMEILRIRKAKPEIVFLPGTPQDMGRVLAQSEQLGFRPQWLSYAAFEDPEVLSVAGDAGNGVIFPSLALDWEKAAGLQAEFRESYQNRFDDDPSIYAASTFDAMLILADAVRSVGYSPEEIRGYLLEMDPFIGASGPTEFRADGTVNKPLVFKTVVRGKFVALNSGKDE